MKLLKQIRMYELPAVLGYPALIWQFFFLYLPLIILLGYSFIYYDPVVGKITFSIKHYVDLCTSDYARIIFNSFFIALLTSFLCLIFAYPLAYYLVLCVNQRYRPYLIFSLIIPSWTSLIVQIYAWLFLLNKDGVLHHLLSSVGLVSSSASLLNNYFSILISMVSVYLPFMILPIFSTLRKIDKTLLEASADLGANRFETFKRIILPLSKPGIIIGFVLVFLPAFGEFAIPTLLGGSKISYWGNLIVEKFLRSHNWTSGAAFALVGVLFLITLLMVAILVRRFIRFMYKKGY